MDENILQTVFREVRSAQRFLIASHIRPDGDAVGSLIGLGLSLLNIGKDVQMVLSDGVPAIFRHLEGSELVKKKSTGDFDMTLVVDCSDLNRAGNAINNNLIPDLNLDHHPTNTNFAKYNLVDETAVATSEMLTEILPRFGFPFSKDVADALLFGMITDTLGFRTYNMTPKALRLAAELMEVGGNLPHLYQLGLLNRTFTAARYWGAGLSKIQQEGRMAWATLTLDDRHAVGYPGRDDADLISFLSTIDDVDVVIMFVEQRKEQVKVSWRSKPGIDVTQVAQQFGGGGHAAAAGAMIEGNLKEIQENVIAMTQTTLGLKV
jgi:phosphoesterase RecJ-like protein